MFELKTPTDVKLAKFTPRVEKHGKEEVSAATLKLYFHRTPAQLDEIAPGLSDMLLKAVEAPRQGLLPSVEPTHPTLVKRCSAAQVVQLKLTTEGATLKIDRGIDESDPMVIAGCKVDAVEIDEIDDDGAMVSCNVGSNDLSEDEGGWLYGHQRRVIRVHLLAPEIKPDAIDGSTEAFRADHPDATDLFAAGGPDDEREDESEGGQTDVELDEDAAPELEGRLGNALASDRKPRRRKTAAA